MRVLAEIDVGGVDGSRSVPLVSPNALLSFREGAKVNSATAQGSLLGRGSYVGDFWRVK